MEAFEIVKLAILEIIKPKFRSKDEKFIQEDIKDSYIDNVMVQFALIILHLFFCCIYSVYNLQSFIMIEFLCIGCVLLLLDNKERKKYYCVLNVSKSLLFGPILLTNEHSRLSMIIVIDTVIPAYLLCLHKSKKVLLISALAQAAKFHFYYPTIMKQRFRYVIFEDIETIISQELMTISFLMIFLVAPIYMFYLAHFEYAKINKETLSQLKESRESLEKIIKERESFVLSLSHEVRNPLNSILGNVELCFEECKDEKLKSRLKNAKCCGELLLGLLNNILDVGKIERDEFEMCPTECAIVPILEKIWATCSALIRNKGLTPVFDVKTQLPRIIIIDQYRLTQILFNLVSNAVKFTNKGEIRLRIWWIDDRYTELNHLPTEGERLDTMPYIPDEDNGVLDQRTVIRSNSLKKRSKSVVIDDFEFSDQIEFYENERTGKLKFEIIDTGIGMTGEAQTSLFQKYTQVGNSEHKRLGTGLGLWITKKICENMQGKIEVASQIGIGTTFIVEIKTKSCKFVKSPNITKRSLRGSNIFSDKLRVLIVDDVKFNAEIIEGFLNKRAHDLVGTAENGKQAVEMYIKSIEDNRPINLITMDIEMPIMDGKAACVEIRKYEKMKNQKPAVIIIVSANTIKTEIDKCLDPNGDIRASHFIRKPVKKHDFEAILKSAFSIRAPLFSLQPVLQKKTHILVADDDHFNLIVIDDMLKKGGISTYLASNGLEATEIFKKNNDKIKLILMDCQMNIMDGFTATKLILDFAVENELDKPVIFGLTGYSDISIEKKCKDVGMINMIKKPVPSKDLLNLVSKF